MVTRAEKPATRPAAMPKRSGPSETGGLPHGVEEPVLAITEQSGHVAIRGVVEQSTARAVCFSVGRRWLRKRLSAFCVARRAGEIHLQTLGMSLPGRYRNRAFATFGLVAPVLPWRTPSRS